VEPDVYARLAGLERSNRLLRTWFLLAATGVAVFAGTAALGFRRPRLAASPAADSLVVREVVVVDSQGTVRVRIGAHLPAAVIHGRRVPRGEDASGILLYDDEGRERGGYVTFSPSRNVALTLDTRYRQVALFAADSGDGVAARLWSGTNWVDMRADTMGAHLSVGHSRELVFQQPPMTEAETAAGCSELKAELTHVAPQPPRERVLAACKEHMPDAACRECLGIP
jgi:hypothetical protein